MELESKLVNKLMENGVPEEIARKAARKCTKEMAKQGLGWAAGSALLAFLVTKNPKAAGVVGAMVAWGSTFLPTPTCREINEAAEGWASWKDD